MDPVSALGVAAAAVQFVDVAWGLIKETQAVWNASTKSQDEIEELKGIALDLMRINDELVSSSSDLALDDDVQGLCKQCSEVAQQLIDALNKLIRKSNRKWESFMKALREVWTKEEIERLVKRIAEFRELISNHILLSFRKKFTVLEQGNERIRISVENAAEIARNVQDQLATITEERDHWERSLLDTINRSYATSSDPSSWPRYAREGLDEGGEERFSKLIRERLSFAHRDDREREISAAQKKTYEWIFDANNEGQKWTSFSNWLQSNDPEQRLYWIAGKAGSGKSTLMKFICNDQRTTKLLQAWSGPNLCMLSFYFWNSNSVELQMSQEGLVRTLLYQALQKIPHIVSSLFPNRLESYLLLGPGITWQRDLTWAEMLKAFNTLVEDSAKSTNLAIFIDGLDEYKGNHEELMKLVHFILDVLNANIKICVSSRPWNVFEDEFGTRPNLHLEDLTLSDMTEFVRSQFQEHKGFKDFRDYDPEQADKLVDNIVEKSDGVFLWTHLATRSLLEGLTGGEKPKELQRRLDALPRELEHLFGKMLDDLDEIHYKRAIQLFQIIKASVRTMTLLLFYFADEDDHDAATDFKPGIDNTRKLNVSAKQMQRRINECTKGLLEHSRDTRFELAERKVAFVHRTVRDFIYGEANASRLARATDFFNADAKLSQAWTSYLKSRNPDHLDLATFQDWAMIAIEHGVRAQQSSLQLQTDLLKDVDSAAIALANTPNSEGRVLVSRRYWGTTLPNSTYCSSLLHLACQGQLVDYVRKNLPEKDAENRVETVSSLLTAAMFGFTAFKAWDNFSCLAHDALNVEFIQLLFENGADPNYRFNPVSQTLWEAASRKFNKNTSVLKLFVSHGADPEAKWMGTCALDDASRRKLAERLVTIQQQRQLEIKQAKQKGRREAFGKLFGRGRN